MRGSIAIWQETNSMDADGYAPRAEVHINIWRNNQRKKTDYFDLFDIGFRFEELRALRSLSISLPFVVKPENVTDLFEVMHDTSTLSAIFNDTLTPTSMMEGARYFKASHTESQRVQFFVWRCQETERQISTIGDGRERGTVISIGDEFFDRLRKHVGDHYFRLRIKVPIGTDNGFVSSIDPQDSAFLSTISTSEIVEFRLNERRNFSNAIRDRLQGNHCSLINISAVRYFLIRDMGVEMTQSHTGFRKMRRLEPGMWVAYLKGSRGFNPDEMIIYHWNGTSPSGALSLESFTALATFRAYYTGRLWVYVFVIAALGAMGSAAQTIGATLLTPVAQKCCASSQDAILANLFLILTVIGALTLLVQASRDKKRG